MHDPLIKDINNNTVGIYLAIKGIIPPKEWMHNVNLYNKDWDSIKSLL